MDAKYNVPEEIVREDEIFITSDDVNVDDGTPIIYIRVFSAEKKFKYMISIDGKRFGNTTLYSPTVSFLTPRLKQLTLKPTQSLQQAVQFGVNGLNHVRTGSWDKLKEMQLPSNF